MEKSKNILNENTEVVHYMEEVNKGNIEAHYQLAEWYFNELKNPVHNNEKIYTLCKTAAETGHVKAQYLLGLCYEEGIGVEKDIAQAFEWYKLAADQGLAAAQYKVGMCFSYEDFRIKLFLHWTEMAAEQNDPDALFEKGECCELGIDCDVEYEKANEYYKKAAELVVSQSLCKPSN